MSLREQGKERRRQRIFQAALSLLSEGGLEALKTSELAQRAEVSVATLYNLLGSRNDIVDLLVPKMFGDFQAYLSTSCDDQYGLQRIDAYAEAAYHFVKADEVGNRAALKAIFNLGVSRGSSSPVTEVSRQGNQLLCDALRQCQQQSRLLPTAPLEMMAEQMVFSQSILLESWAAEFISLERYRLTCRLHFWTVLAAWADDQLIKQSRNTLQLLQQQISRLTQLAKQPGSAVST